MWVWHLKNWGIRKQLMEKSVPVEMAFSDKAMRHLLDEI
jgi:hypothetical protein